MQEMPGNCWPSRQDLLLLQACVWKGPPALDAWRRWRTAADLNALDTASRRLLPLAYQRLRSELQHDPDRPRLKGLLRATWYKNEILLHRAADVLRVFATHDISAVVLKGAALAICYPGYGAARTMDDIDLLVRREDVAAALRLMIDCGWRAGPPLSPRRGANRLRMLFDAASEQSKKRSSDPLALYHAVGLCDAHGAHLDLHWCLGDVLSMDHELLWRTAMPATLRGSPTSVLSDTVNLVHVIVHGLRWSPLAPMRWAVDAATIIEHAGPAFAWATVIEHARQSDAVPWVRDGLTFLRDPLQVPVPDTVVRTLNDDRVSRDAQTIYALVVRSPGFLSDIPLQWRLLRRLSPTLPRLTLLRDLVRLFRLRWGVRRIWQLPVGAAARFLSRRLTGALPRPAFSEPRSDPTK